jgi:hypothetical protein
MKKLFSVLFMGIIVLSLHCGADSVDVRISLTNPNNKTVPFNGYYILTATSDSIVMDAATPGEYSFTLEKGDGVSGSVFKDTTDVVDTLHFQVFFGDEEKLSQKVTTLLEVIQFQIEAL